MGLIFVTTLCLISGSLLTTAEEPRKEGPLCRNKERKFQVLSLFNLFEETIIHTKDQKGKIDFWRVSGAYHKDRFSGNIKSENIPPNVTQLHYSDSGLATKQSLKETAISMNFDIEQQIMAYVLPIINDLVSECITNTSTLPKSSCATLWAMSHNDERLRYFICIKGVNSRLKEKETKLAIYESYKEQIPGIIDRVSDLPLYDRVYPYCRDELMVYSSPSSKNSLDIISFSNWKDYNTNEWYNTSVFLQKDIKYKKLMVESKTKLYGVSHISFCLHHLSKSEGWFLFHFSNVYEHMFCGKNCTLDSNLLWVEYYRATDDLCKPWIRLNMTLRRLLGCDGRNNPLEPLEPPPEPDTRIEGPLCTNKEREFKVLSLFNLVEETIIHTKDKNGEIDFWRVNGAYNKKNITGYGRDKIVPDVTKGHYSDSDLLKTLSLKKTALNLNLDIRQQIIAYVLPIVNELQSECNTTANTLPKSSCDTLWAMANNSKLHFICINGVNRLLKAKARIPAIYESNLYEFQGFIQQISDLPLYDKVYTHCQNEHKLWHQPDHRQDADIVSVSIWKYSNKWYTTFVAAFQEVHKQHEKVVVVSLIRIKEMSYDVNCSHSMSKSIGWFVFRFNQYYEHMFCGRDCTLDSSLLWIEYGMANGVCMPVKYANLTLRRLLGCDGRDNPLEAPVPPIVPPKIKRPQPSFVTTEGQEGPLCGEDAAESEVLNIFSLSNQGYSDTFIQMKDQSGDIIFWKIPYTVIHPDNQTIINPNVTERHHTIDQSLLYKSFNITQPVGAFISPDFNQLRFQCFDENPPINERLDKYCQILRENNLTKNWRVRHRFVCLFGVDRSTPKQITVPVLFDTVEKIKVFQSVSDLSMVLYAGALESCQNELLVITGNGALTVVSMYNLWHRFWRNVSIIFNDSMGTDLVKVRGIIPLNNTFDMKFEEQFYRKDVWSVFSLNAYYKYLFCGQKCNLYTALIWMTFSNEDDSLRVDLNSNLTLRSLLGCKGSPSYYAKKSKPFEPPTHSRDNEGHLCSDEDRNFHVISIFSIEDQTFIHTKDQTAKFDIWRIWGAYNTRTDNDYDMPLNVTEKHYSDKRILQYFRGENFDLTKQIITYVLPNYEYLLSQCSQMDTNITQTQTDPTRLSNRSCRALQEYMSKNCYFVCIIGVDSLKGDTKRVAVVFEPTNGQLKRIHIPELSEKVQPFCGNNSFLEDNRGNNINGPFLKSFSNWKSISYPYGWHNISVFYTKHNGGLPFDHNVMLRMIINGEVTEYKEKNQSYTRNFWFVFRINNYYKHFFCGQLCTLDTLLLWINYTESNGVIERIDRNIELPNAKLTIRKLLGCKKKAIPFEPNKFCDTNEKFLSFFNLGEDLYFQKSGRFWRYRPPVGKYHNLFTKEANPKIQMKFGSITYESGVTELISKTFDTSRPVVGFTFRMHEIDICPGTGRNKSLCADKYYKSEQHLRTCIYGCLEYKFCDQNSVLPKYNASAFMYTPSGLRPFRGDEGGTAIQSETTNYCEFIYWAFRIKNNLNEEEYKLTSIANPGYFYLKGIPYNYVLFVFTKKSSASPRIFVNKWSTNQSLLQDLLDKKFDYFEILPFKLKSPVIFTLGTDIWGFDGDLNNRLKQISYIFNGQDYLNPTTKLESTNKKILDLVDCPVNTTTTLVAIGRRETPCQYNRSADTESIFMIAGTLYHQVGQHFHAYDKQKLKFLYDKYVSELFHQYFDTTYRVTGYSLKDAVHKDRHIVIIHGRSNYVFKHFEKHLFAAFHINASDPLSKLSAINDPKYFNNKEINFTLGFPEQLRYSVPVLAMHRRLNTSDNNTHIPLVTVVIEAYEDEPRPNPFENLTSGKPFIPHINPKVIFPNFGGLSPVFVKEYLVLPEHPPNRNRGNRFNFFFTNHTSEEMFALNAINFYDRNKTKDTQALDPIRNKPIWDFLPFTDKEVRGQILGIAEFDNGFQAIVYHRYARTQMYLLGNTSDGFWIKLTFDYRLKYCSNVSEASCEFRGTKFNCSHSDPVYFDSPPGEHPSESSDDKILMKSLAFVVLVLLITALIVGFIVFYTNKKYYKESENPRVETLQPNRPNYTVVRHPDPKPTESESNKSLVDKTVRSDEI